MRNWIALISTCGLASAVALTVALTTAPAPAAAAAATTKTKLTQATPKRYSIDDFMATTSIRGASFSADESRVLFSSNESGIFNAYAIPVGGGVAQALTRSTTDSVYAETWFPSDDRVLFTRDQAGNELNHLFVRELDGSERDLTPGDKLKASFVDFTPDGTAFFVISNERDAKFFDLYRYDAKTYARSLLFKNDKGYNIAAISRDGRWLALGVTKTTHDADVFLADLLTGEIKHITPHQSAVKFNAETFDPGSHKLWMLSDEGSEFSRLVSYELDTGTLREEQKADWDIAYSLFSRDGKRQVTGINQDGSLVVQVRDVATGQPVTLPALPAGELRSVTFSKSGQRMAFNVNGDRAPSNLFVYDFGTRKLTQLTQSLSKNIRTQDLVEARVVRFKSFDGMVIPSIYYQPQAASTTQKVPAVVFVHGGPGGQSTRGYSALMQYMANQGYAVLAINNRGSSGYGKTFFAADDGKHGREPLWDCIEAKTWLAATGHVDPERIAIMGGSYGGYMTLAAMAFRPEAFKVGVNIFGVSNWLRTLESIPPYWEAFRTALYAEIGDPVKDRDRLIATSPLFHAKEIRRPLLVVQGANDPRVIKVESDEIVDAVKKNGVPVEYLVFNDEGHGFSKKANQLQANRRIVEFLDKHLKGNN